MKRRTLLLGSLAAACSRGPRLNVYNWSDYIAPETVPQFEREFGVRIHYGTYESNQEMLAQVMSGNSGWDVVFPSEDFLEPMRALIAASRREAGCLLYAWGEDVLDPGLIRMIEHWRDWSSFVSHDHSPHAAAWKRFQ